MNNLKKYIIEKLKLTKDIEHSEVDEEVNDVQDFIIDYYHKKYKIEYDKHYKISVDYLDKGEIIIYIKFDNKVVHESIIKTGKDLCIEMEKEIGYDYYWSADWKNKQLKLHNRFI